MRKAKVLRKITKEQIINLMNDRIIHRGPDASGVFVSEYVALGQRRLSIIDLSDNGNQPLYNEDKSILVVFNGEIYNYLELKKILIENGHVFSTDTDTEVLVHGYEEWGYDLVKRLRGMFAFCIYDTNSNELFLARDHFGIKPLYYYKDKDNWENGVLYIGKHLLETEMGLSGDYVVKSGTKSISGNAFY